MMPAMDVPSSLGRVFLGFARFAIAHGLHAAECGSRWAAHPLLRRACRGLLGHAERPAQQAASVYLGTSRTTTGLTAAAQFPPGTINPPTRSHLQGHLLFLLKLDELNHALHSIAPAKKYPTPQDVFFVVRVTGARILGITGCALHFDPAITPARSLPLRCRVESKDACAPARSSAVMNSVCTNA